MQKKEVLKVVSISVQFKNRQALGCCVCYIYKWKNCKEKPQYDYLRYQSFGYFSWGERRRKKEFHLGGVGVE